MYLCFVPGFGRIVCFSSHSNILATLAQILQYLLITSISFFPWNHIHGLISSRNVSRYVFRSRYILSELHMNKCIPKQRSIRYMIS